MSAHMHWQRGREFSSRVPVCIHLTGLLGTARAKNQTWMVGSRIGQFILLFRESWAMVILAGCFIALHSYIFCFSNGRGVQW